MKGVIAFVAVASVLVAALVWSQRPSGPLVVSGFIEVDEIRIGSLVGGRVASVAVREGAAVRKGDALVELEPYDLGEQKAAALAELAIRQAELDRLAAGFRAEDIAQADARRQSFQARLQDLENGPREQEITEARALVELAAAQVELADLELARITTLTESDVVSAEEKDRAATEQRVTRSRLSAAQARLDLLLEGTRPEAISAARAQLAEATATWNLKVNGARPEDITAAQAAVQAAKASLGVVERRLEELTVRASVDGTVEAVELQPGDLIAPNAPVISLMDPSRLWVRAYVPENHLNLRVGQELQISVDSYPGERFRSHVSFIAREAEFTPSNVQTPEERSKQVFRIHVELDEGLDRLRAGMSADVYLESSSDDG